ncbi:MAG TPA: response regulator transcription factor [Bacteroidia bacterium]|nr:response regulator transcription factor [Bacteroidia bacterium]
MKPIDIAIFEDNFDRRKSLSMLIESDPRLKLVGCFEDANNVLDKIESCNPHLVLMDIIMPGISGIDAVKTIKDKYPQINIIIQTSFEDDDYIFNSIKHGADGYVLKKSDPEKILEAIIDVCNGGAHMSPGIAQRVMKHFRFDHKSEHPSDLELLSEREQQILKLLVEGKSYKMIAAEVHLSYHTVNSHIKKIYTKLQVNSAGEAISIAIRNNMV